MDPRLRGARGGRAALAGLAVVVASLFPLPRLAGAEPADRLVGIAPLEEDLEAMRSTLRRLETALASGRPEAAEELLAPTLTDAARESALEAVAARIESIPPGATYRLRSDIGPGAVVPVGPERVQVQVTGSVVAPGRPDDNGAVYLELVAVERGGGRGWLLRSVRFSGVRSGPTPAGAAGLVAAAVAAGVVVVGAALLVALRLRRGAARRRPGLPARRRLR